MFYSNGLLANFPGLAAVTGLAVDVGAAVAVEATGLAGAAAAWLFCSKTLVASFAGLAGAGSTCAVAAGAGFG